MAVPEIVEPDPRQILWSARMRHELVREAVRLDRRAVRLRENVGIVREPDAEPQQLLGLAQLGAAAAPRIAREGRATVRARPLLVSFCRHALAGLLGALGDRRAAPRQGRRRST